MTTPTTQTPAPVNPEPGPAPQPEHLELAVMPDLQLDQAARTITGLLLPFNVIAQRTSAGPVMFRPGSFRHHPDLKRLKLLIDHDQTRCVGYATRLDITDAGVVATFYVPPGVEGDEALAKAANGVRDGLSIGTDLLMKHSSADGTHTVVTEAYGNEGSLVSLPAFTDSRVTTVNASHHQEDSMTQTSPEPTAPATPAEPQPAATPASPTSPPASGDSQPSPAPAPTVVVNQPAPQPAQFAQPPAPFTGQHAPTGSVTAAAATAAAIVRNGGGAAELRAALSDVVPADDAGNGFIGRPGWLGELWQARRVARPIMEAFGPIGALTKMKDTGWQWVTRPEVEAYEGNKTEIPSNEVETRPVEVVAERTAGGWDVDRIFVDLGEADMVEALFRAAIEDYTLKSEAWAVAKLRAAATAVAAQDSLGDALVELGIRAGAIGASIGTIAFGSGVWARFLKLKRDDLPWWINPNTAADITEGSMNLGNLRLSANPTLGADELVAGDRRAATFKEARVRVNAIDLPRGGVDLGVFAYHSCLINDPRAIFRTTVPAPVVEG